MFGSGSLHLGAVTAAVPVKPFPLTTWVTRPCVQRGMACPWSPSSAVLSLFSGTCTSPTCRRELPRLSVQPWMAQRGKCFSQLAWSDRWRWWSTTNLESFSGWTQIWSALRAVTCQVCAMKLNICSTVSAWTGHRSLFDAEPGDFHLHRCQFCVGSHRQQLLVGSHLWSN